jgi:hypothetical protein
VPNKHPQYRNLSSAPLLETIVTTVAADGTPHVAAMGPRVSADFRWLLLRPFAGTTTWANLEARGRGVVQIVDDVTTIVRAALNLWPQGLPPLVCCGSEGELRLADCCRWYSFVVDSSDSSQPRCELVCRVEQQGQVNDMRGYCRADFAVIEAAILATRLHLISADEIAAEINRLAVIVDKTAGPLQRQAFDLVKSTINQRLGREAAR